MKFALYFDDTDHFFLHLVFIGGGGAFLFKNINSVDSFSVVNQCSCITYLWLQHFPVAIFLGHIWSPKWYNLWMHPRLKTHWKHEFKVDCFCVCFFFFVFILFHVLFWVFSLFCFVLFFTFLCEQNGNFVFLVTLIQHHILSVLMDIIPVSWLKTRIQLK